MWNMSQLRVSIKAVMLCFYEKTNNAYAEALAFIKKYVYKSETCMNPILT